MAVVDEEYSKYQASAVADTKELDNLVDFVTEYAETNLPYLQRRALGRVCDRRINDEGKLSEIQTPQCTTRYTLQSRKQLEELRN